MSKPQSKLLLLYTGDPENVASHKVIAAVNAPHIVVRSQDADLRDTQDKLIATLTWTTLVQVREV